MTDSFSTPLSSMPVTELLPPSIDRIPVVDQALELATMMETYNKSDEIAVVLRAAARVLDLYSTTSYLVSNNES